LLASALVHAAAAATLGGALGSHARGSNHAEPAAAVELDVTIAPGVPSRFVGTASSAPRADRPVHRPHPSRARLEPVKAAAPPSEQPAGVPATAASSEDRPRFALSAGTVATGPGIYEAPEAPRGTASKGGPGSSEAAGAAAHGDREVDVAARPLSSPPPIYPPAAQHDQIEGDVSLEIVVGPEGHVVSARVLGAPGYGLGEAARDAVLHYRFSPAMRGGRAVSVRMRWVVQFRLE
jgi:protein TonB